MARHLARTVHVRDDRGVPHVFGPADDVPAWAEGKISNPAAWSDGSALPTEPSGRGPTRVETQRPPEAAQAAPDGGPPPQRGPGSGTAAWRAYAEANGVQVAPDADRGDVITACREAGVPVE